MNLNNIEMLTLLGAIQGIGLSSILFYSRKHRSLANRLLAVFVSLFSLHIVREIFESHGYMDDFHWIRAVSLTFTGYYGPLLYLYVQTLTRVETKLTIKHARHFILAIGVSSFFSIAVLNGLTDWHHLKPYPWLSLLVNILQLLVVLQTIIYVCFCFRQLNQYRVWLKDNYSNVDRLGYLWLTRLLTGFVSLLFVWVVVFGADMRFLEVKHLAWVFDLFWLGISLFIYWIGYYSILKPEILTQVFKNESNKRASEQLDKETISRHKNALIELFDQEKIYLDPDLTLQQLADKVGINEKKLSQVLNSGFNQTFYNLINQYRVEEVKRCLQLAQHSQSKLEVLAYEAGFKSPSTFNRQFKKFTQMTPKAYRETCSV